MIIEQLLIHALVKDRADDVHIVSLCATFGEIAIGEFKDKLEK